MPAMPRPSKKSQELYEFIMGKPKNKDNKVSVKTPRIKPRKETENEGSYYER